MRLLLLTACIIVNTTALPAFAAHTGGHTDVTARIENVQEETENAGSGDVIPEDGTEKATDSQPERIEDNSRTNPWIALLITSGCLGFGAVLYGRKKHIK